MRKQSFGASPRMLTFRTAICLTFGSTMCLISANLMGSNLGQHLKGCDLRGADLTDANLSDAT